MLLLLKKTVMNRNRKWTKFGQEHNQKQKQSQV